MSHIRPDAPLCSPDDLRVEEVREVGALQSLGAEWKTLWERSGQTPFQSPMWLLPWATHFCGTNLLVLSFRLEGRLVAVAPFYTWDEDGRAKLLLLGNGISDYLDICLGPDHTTPVLTALRNWLRDHDEIAAVEFNQLPINSPLAGAFEAEGLIGPGDCCPVLHLNGKGLQACALPRQCEKLRYYRRRAQKLGRLETELAQGDDCGPRMQDLFRLHGLRWRERGETGVLDDPQIQSFHVEAAKGFASCGRLRLHSLFLNGTVVGVLYGFADERTTYFYLSGFDPKWEKISPGTLLVGAAVEQALTEEHSAFDFLRGSEHYKYAWGAEDRPTVKVAGKLEKSRVSKEGLPPCALPRPELPPVLPTTHRV